MVGSLRHDLATLDHASGAQLFIDVGITSMGSVGWNAQPWPSASQVEAEVERNRADPAVPDFFWEDHRNEHVHPDVERARAFRSLCTQRSVGACIRFMEHHKERHFQDNFQFDQVAGPVRFVPFVLTAGGGLGSLAREVYTESMKTLSDKLSRQSEYRRDCFGRISIILVGFASRMAKSLTVLTHT